MDGKRCMDGWKEMHGWMERDACMDGWMDGCIESERDTHIRNRKADGLTGKHFVCAVHAHTTHAIRRCSGQHAFNVAGGTGLGGRAQCVAW